MMIYKFGGASVKDANSVKNVAKIITQSDSKLIVIVSAMGKMTNSLEKIHELRMNKSNYSSELDHFIEFHQNIVSELFEMNDEVISVDKLFAELKEVLTKTPSNKWSFEYDQIICFGELISTKIISEYCNLIGIKNNWLNARLVIRTDNNYQYAEVNWSESQLLMDTNKTFTESNIIITQGFIASDSAGNSTSLGREGSDFSAGIFGYLSSAQSVTIWKDVPGMLNADPKFFDETVKIDAISYREAIELSYYGASVIHPKTVKPLENKNIPLYIKSFQEPSLSGTIIQKSEKYDADVASYIIKEGQTLVTLSPKDFSFIEEKQMSSIFKAVFDCGIHLNMMQNSALSLSLVFDHKEEKLNALIKGLQSLYQIRYNLDLKLLNLRHYNESIIEKLTSEYEVILRQQTRVNIRLVLR